MKSKLIVAMLSVALIMGVMCAPQASAENAVSAWAKNAGKNVGRAVVCPFKAVARIADAGYKSVTLQEPAAILGSWTIAREEATDVVESVIYRAVVGKEIIGLDESGTVSSYIEETKWLGPLVDMATALPIAYGVAHNSGSVGHVGKAAWTGTIGIGACSAVSNYTK